MKRAQFEHILQDLEKKMVLIVGPRQAGKTFVAKEIAKHFKKSVYLNYDQITDRDIIRKQSWLGSTELLVLDELHKMPDWKNYLKGLYDTKPKSMRLLVTGSARLDIFDHMGDSLAGRYYRHRLLPLSMAELNLIDKKPDIDRLISHSGFPEPYLSENITQAQRWRMQYVNSLLSTDVFEFEKVHNLKAMRLVFDMLRVRVGSPLSYQSIAEDVGISPVTVKKYIEILESLFVIFRVTPYSKNIARSLMKEPKIYFFDTGLVNGDSGAKFENFVAFSLLKYSYYKVDYEAKDIKLKYLRTKDKKEVDFAIIEDEEIKTIIECKYSNNSIPKSLVDFKIKYNLDANLVVKELKHEQEKQGIKILKADNFLIDLSL